MKDSCWRQKADELQLAADRKDSKFFFDGLKAVLGPKSSGTTPIYSYDGTLLTDKQQILSRWATLSNSTKLSIQCVTGGFRRH